MKQTTSFFLAWALLVHPALAQQIVVGGTAPAPLAPVSAQPAIVPPALVPVPTPAPAATASDGTFTQSPAYKECTTLATTNPVAAEQNAQAWLQIDDGIGAHHCRAMALYGQRRFAESADALAIVRSKIDPTNVALRSYVARQGSKAWLDAGRPDAAIATIGAQIDDMAQVQGRNASVSQLTSELLHDRARLRITYGQLTEAVQDLDHAVTLTPSNEAVLMERAGTFAQLGDLALAKEDVASVLKLNPTHAKARELQRLLNNPTGK